MTEHFIHDGWFMVVCDACGAEVEKGEYYQEADAGEIYCRECVIED